MCAGCPAREPCECESRPDYLHAIHVGAWLIGYLIRCAFQLACWLFVIMVKVMVAFWLGAALLLWGLIGGRKE